MAVGDLAELALYSHLVGYADTYVSIFGFKAIDAGATFANLASAFKTAMVKNTSGGLFYSHHVDHYSGNLQVRDVHPGTAAVYDYTYTNVVGNLGTQDAAPPVNALVVSWRTALAGRAYRGRSYQFGFHEADQDNGLWLAAGPVAAADLMVTNMLATFGPGGTDANWQFVIISRTLNGAIRTPPVGTPVTAGISRQPVYTQRRRIVGYGS